MSDLVEEKARDMASRLSCEWCIGDEQLLCRDDIDLVVIMSESGHHYEHANSALASGKHVVVEKPPCMFPAQIQELKQLARKSGLMYAPVFQNRFNPAMRVLKEAQDTGRFGKLVCVSVRLFWCRYQEYYEDGWHGTWRMDGGVINQQAIHHVDAMRWVCGPVSSVIALQDKRLNKLEAEDTTVAVVRFEDGALGTIEATTAARPEDMDASLTLIGESGYASIGGIALNMVNQWCFSDQVDDGEEVKRSWSQEVENGYGYSHGPLLQEIIQRVHSDSIVPPISADSAADTVALIHSLYRSAEDRRPVYVNMGLLSRSLGF